MTRPTGDRKRGPGATRPRPAAVAAATGMDAGSSAAVAPWAPDGRPRRRAASREAAARRWLAPVAGIAAALVVVGGLVAVLRAVGSTTKSSTSSARAPPSVQSPALSSGADAGPAPAADLGSQSDPAALARLVTSELAASTSAGRQRRGQPARGPAGTAGPSGTGSTGAPAPAPGRPRPVRLAPPARTVQSVPARHLGPGPHLRARGRAERSACRAATVPRALSVVYTASLRWRGQPARVVVFSGPSGRSGAVMAYPACSSLAVLPL